MIIHNTTKTCESLQIPGALLFDFVLPWVLLSVTKCACAAMVCPLLETTRATGCFLLAECVQGLLACLTWNEVDVRPEWMNSSLFILVRTHSVSFVFC